MLKMGISDAGEPCFSIPTVAIEALMKSESKTPTAKTSSLEILHQSPLAESSNLSDNERHFLGLFLLNFNPYHQFLDSFCPEQQVQSLASGGTVSSRPDIQFLSYAVYAVGAHFMEHCEKELWLKQYTSLAENLVTNSCSKNPEAASIKGLSLMCWAEMMNDNENLAWIVIIAIATGMMFSLGYHVTTLEKFSDVRKPEEIDEMASRVRSF